MSWYQRCVVFQNGQAEMARILGEAQPLLSMPRLYMPTVGKFEGLHGISPTVELPERSAMRIPFHHKRLLAVRLAQTDDQFRAKALRRLRDLVLVARLSHNWDGLCLIRQDSSMARI